MHACVRRDLAIRVGPRQTPEYTIGGILTGYGPRAYLREMGISHPAIVVAEDNQPAIFLPSNPVTSFCEDQVMTEEGASC